MNKLKPKLLQWTDADVAQHEVAKCLGLFDENSCAADFKWVYWSNNPLGGAN